MKEELLLLRNQLKMGHRILLAEAMLLQKAIDILVNKAGNSPAIGVDLASGQDRTVEVRYVAPPGYVMVPVEPTKEILDEFDSIIDYGAEDSVDAWHRLLVAAPQEVK
ncbi:TPA: hypothetical protein ACGQTI_003818 [Klebsiella pneumoniae]|jgi:hypothetical protein|uniref:hypothetical protein n=1 Tax=Enterobacteriaceae TaxID=543 RepID=UPI000E215796|nr:MULTISPECIES: hypothetical protein [Enterobacteriaceae]DAV81400.1 MAG TPA: hypothetical protein [Caudoviricetes sp.]HDU5066270.1 hypothetical protein [Klebsiella pneumoniae subsp. pneumoniae]EKY0525469.1 hypothetical protein [Klebsiella pneumoniae]MCL7663712.1 hypothetical protein [Klebsiella pneumoniae]MCP5928916.1 hypothetical protein [Klebsiella pneumoniae]